MPVTPALPRLKRVTPGMWVAATWCAVTLYSFVSYVPLPAGRFPLVADPAGRLPLVADPAGSGALGVPVGGWPGTAPQPGPTRPGHVLVLLLFAGGLMLAAAVLLERRPLPAFALLAAASLLAAATHTSTVQSAMDLPLENYLAVDVALGFIAAQHPARTSRLAGATALAGIAGWMAVKAFRAFPFAASMDLMVALTVLVAWLIGNSVRQNREHARVLGDRAAEQAVTTERLRISRELHDAVAHSVGIIALQSGAARRCMTTQPEEARDAMAAVERASRETLSGLRRMLGALRQSEAVPLAPAPDLADVDRLAAATTAAGVRVDVVWLGNRAAVPAEIGQSVFRIVQESVTNVVRHSGARACRVVVAQEADGVRVEVVDRGRGTGGGGGGGVAAVGVPGPGFGLAGMRERVALLGGEFTAAPHPDGGFQVLACIPIREIPEAPAGPRPIGAR